MSILSRTKQLFIICLLAVFCTASTALAAGPIVLKFADTNPATSKMVQNGLLPWLKMIEDDAQGTIKFEVYHNSTLSNANQNFASVKSGIADASWNTMSMYMGMNPLMEIVTLPGLPDRDPLVLVERLWDIYETIPAAQEFYKRMGVKMLCVYPADSIDGLHFIKPIKTLEDVQGLKMHSLGSAPAVAGTRGLGAVAVPMLMTDVYLSLQKGTIEGCWADWDPYASQSIYEVAPYTITNGPMGGSHFSVIINENKFNSLPKVAQDAILKHSGRAGSRWLTENFSISRRLFKPEFLAKGVKLITLSPEEEQRWLKATRPAWNLWYNYALEKGVTEADAKKALEIMTRE